MKSPECILETPSALRRAGSGRRKIFFQRSCFDDPGAGAVAFDCRDKPLGGGADCCQRSLELFSADVVRREIVRGHVVNAEVPEDDVGCGFGFQFALAARLLFRVAAVPAVMQIFVD